MELYREKMKHLRDQLEEANDRAAASGNRQIEIRADAQQEEYNFEEKCAAFGGQIEKTHTALEYSKHDRIMQDTEIEDLEKTNKELQDKINVLLQHKQ